jgi:hypothetical protein
MSDEEREQRDDIKPPDDARRLSAPPDPVAKWRRAADERVRQRQEAELVAAGETASRDWIEQRLEQERKLIFDVIGEALGQALAEQRDTTSLDAEIATEFARLWKAVVETKTMLVDICRERVETARKNELVDWTKTKVN